MQMHFITGQIISIAAFIVAVAVVHCKQVKNALLGGAALNMLFALSYLFLGGISGSWICIAATILTLGLYYINQQEERKRKVIRIIWCILFTFVYITGTVLSYRKWNDILTCVCAIVHMTSVFQSKMNRYRNLTICNMLLWIIYDFTTMAYINLITHISVLCSTISAKVRLDWK